MKGLKLRHLYAALVYVFLYTPLAVVCVFSFNDSKYSLAWKGFTLKWYDKLLANDSLVDAALRTLTVAGVSATLATVIGTLAAFLLFRFRFPGRKAMFGAIFVMMMSPDIVIGISLLVLFLLVALPLGFWTLLMGHVTLCMPFVAATVYARLRSLDLHVLEAARDLGAGEFQVFRLIVLPLAGSAVLAGWLLSFTLSLDDVLISFFTTGPEYEVLPLRIYSMVRVGVKPDVNALCVLMITFTVAMVLFAGRLLREKQ